MFRFFRILMLGSLIVTVTAQQSPPPSQADGSPNPAPPKGLATRPAEAPVDRDSSGKKLQKIALDVVVTDAAGNPVKDLTKSDFTVLESDQPRPVLSFAAMDSNPRATNPAQAILLIDTVSNSFESIAQERRGIELFLERDGGRLPLPVSIVLFSDTGAKVDQPSTDGKLLIAELRKTFTAVPTLNSAMGGEGSIERFQRSLKVLTQLTTYLGAQPGRKLLLWIGPGWPLLVGSHFGSSEKDKHADWSGIVSFSTYLRQSRTTLYSVDTLSSGASVAHGVYYQNFLKPVLRPQQAESANLALPVLAVQSGGRVVNGSNDLAAEIANCLEDGKSYYTLAFDTLHSEQPSEYRSLAVRVNKPGLTVRTNTGYYAQPGSF